MAVITVMKMLPKNRCSLATLSTFKTKKFEKISTVITTPRKPEAINL